MALKRILPQLADDRVIVQQFHDEARLGMLLAHPNLVTTYDFGTSGGSFFIAMELVRVSRSTTSCTGSMGVCRHALIAAVLCQALEGFARSPRAEG